MSAYFVCCIYSNALQTTLMTMNTDQTALRAFRYQVQHEIPVCIVSWCHNIKMTQPPHGHLHSLGEMAIRWVCHLTDHQICLKQQLKFHFKLATVFSVPL